MDTMNEFLKIRGGFIKVKKDVLTIKQDINELDKVKANKSELQFLINEVGKLKDEMNKILSQGRFIQLIGNVDSKKIHYSNCPFAKKITDEHRIVFENIEEAQKHQFTPCSCVVDN